MHWLYNGSAENLIFNSADVADLDDEDTEVCLRIEAVARESGCEFIFSIKWGEYLLYWTNLIGKMGQTPLFRSRFLFSDSLLVVFQCDIT